jgi:mRNA interferase RelE/StbE
LSYTVGLSKQAQKDLAAFSLDIRVRCAEAIAALAENPRPSGHKKLKGRDNQYRIRVGDYRVIYTIDDGILTVLVVRVAHRRESYR